MQHQFGIAGQDNVTLTMFTTHQEDADLSVNGHGEKLPDQAVTKRHLTFARHRLINHITQGEDISAELPTIFPIQ